MTVSLENMGLAQMISTIREMPVAKVAADPTPKSRLIAKLMSLGAPVQELSDAVAEKPKYYKDFLTKTRDAALALLGACIDTKKEPSDIVRELIDGDTLDLLVAEIKSSIVRFLKEFGYESD